MRRKSPTVWYFFAEMRTAIVGLASLNAAGFFPLPIYAAQHARVFTCMTSLGNLT